MTVTEADICDLGIDNGCIMDQSAGDSSIFDMCRLNSDGL